MSPSSEINTQGWRVGKLAVAIVAAGLLAFGCGSGGGTIGGITVSSTGVPGAGSTGGPRATTTGSLSALSYNVAGLPQGISKSDPARNTPLISPLLKHYDLVLVQEDFFYHRALEHDALHPFRSTPMAFFSQPTLATDGLNRFSRIPFSGYVRQRWRSCNGFFSAGADCLAAKGFSVARHELSPGLTIDVYNVHCDAGADRDDISARADQVAQLVGFINHYSVNQAVIIAGDTNMKPGRRPADAPAFKALLNGANVQDSADFLKVGSEEIDRFLFRSGSKLQIEPVRWRRADEMVDADGEDLSDHAAINVDFVWRRVRR